MSRKFRSFRTQHPSFWAQAPLAGKPTADGVPKAMLRAAAAASVEPLERRVFLSSTTLTAIADTYVADDTPTSNFGSSASLFTKNPSSGETRVSYLEFDLSGVSVINSAVLNLSANLQQAGDPAVTTNVFAVPNPTWSEGSMTFNDRATADSSSMASFNVSSSTPGNVTVDLTQYFQTEKAAGHNTVSVELQNATVTADFVQFSSREGSSAPQVVIDTTPAASAPSASINAPNVTTGSSSEKITIHYSGGGNIQTNTLSGSNITVAPNGGGTALTVSNTVTTTGSGSDVTATYTVSPPNGSTWTSNDNGTYNVTLGANQVEDDNNNFAASTSSSFTASVSDTQAPSVSVTAPNITTANSNPELVKVVYTDATAVKRSTINASDVSITGAAGTITATGVTTSPASGDAATITATYSVPAPSGGWTSGDNGSYTANVSGGSVTDTSNNAIGAASGNFTVSIAVVDTTDPTASISTPADITNANSSPKLITIVYSDDVAVDRSTIGIADINITGAAGTLNPTTVATTPNSGNPATITATYSVPAPSGGWTSDDDGTYTVHLGVDAVKDTAGNGVAAGTKTFSVNIAAADTTGPAASFSAPDITALGTSTQKIIVTYTDAGGVDTTTIQKQNITVTGPGTIGALTVSAVTQSSSTATFVTATYTVQAPGGNPWAVADNGNYTIALNPATPVKDTAGNNATGSNVTFKVNVPPPDTTAPAAQFFVSNVTAPGGTTQTVTVIYTDDNAVDASTVDNSSVTVTDPANHQLTLKTLSKVPATNGPTVTAVYTFDAPGGTWDAADNGTYHVALAANHVKDTSGNAIASGSTTFTVNATIPDTTIPVGAITAPNITAPGGTTELITVLYTDNVGIDTTTIGASDLSVTNPGGNPLTVSSVSTSGTGKTVTATYTAASPGGQPWNASDNGTYNVTLNAGSVTDLAHNGVAKVTTTFSVNATVPDTTPPLATIFAPSLLDATTSPEVITVIYSDAGNVRGGSINGANLFVAGPSGVVTVIAVSTSQAGNAQVITAQYTLASPSSSGWTFAANGTYSVTLLAGQVKDTTGNASPTQTVSFTVNIQKPGDPNDRSFHQGTVLSTPFVAETVLALPSGQTLVVGHTGDTTAGTSQGVLERLNADGTVDTTFGNAGFVKTTAGLNEVFNAAVLQGSSHLVVAGTNGSDFLLERYDLSGTIDLTFGAAGAGGHVLTDFVSGSIDAAYALTLTPAGSLVAGGSSGTNLAFARYDGNGKLDTTFAQGGKQLYQLSSSASVVGGMLSQSDGKVIAVASSGSNVVVLRLNNNGDADTTFGSSGLTDLSKMLNARTDLTTADRSLGLAFQNDGKILVTSRTTGTPSQFGVVRIDTAGNLDPTFGHGGVASTNFSTAADADSVLVQSSGQIIVLGTTTINGSADSALAAFDPSGNLIASFGQAGTYVMNQTGAITPAEEHIGDLVLRAFGTLQSNGRLVIGSSQQSTSTAPATALRRLLIPGADATNTQTFRGTFGVSGKKNVKLTLTDTDGTKVVMTLTRGTANAYTSGNNINLVITGAKGGAVLTITGKGGNGRISLGDVTLSGVLATLTGKTTDLTGTLAVTGGIGSITLGNINGGNITAGGAITTLSAVNVSNAKILSGASLGADGLFGGSGVNADSFTKGTIGTFKVTASVSNSVIAAGLTPGIDGEFLTGDDSVIGGAASVIKTITAKKVDAATRFVAGVFKSASIPKKLKKPTTDSHFLTT